MRLNIISAVSLNMGIGRKGELLYHISDDMKRFKEMTTGHTVIMGKNTYDSLHNKYLPNRRNIVISASTLMYDPYDGAVEMCRSFDDALAKCAGEEDVFIIGGGMVYRTAMNYLKPGDMIYLTEIADVADDADTFFPDIDKSLFELVDSNDYWLTDKKTNLAFRYKTYRRIEKKSDKCSGLKSIFISLPFTGMEDTIKERLDTAISYCERLGKQLNCRFDAYYQSSVDVIIATGKSLEGDSYTDSMVEDVRLIANSDAILMCPGWEYSGGCNVEFNLAKTMKKDIYYLNFFDQ